MLECAECGQNFTSTKWHAKFCTRKCGEAFRRKSRWAVCQYAECGKSFNPSHTKANKYCSRSCAQYAIRPGRWKSSDGYVRVRTPYEFTTGTESRTTTVRTIWNCG